MTRSGQTEASCQGGEPKAALFCAKDEEQMTDQALEIKNLSVEYILKKGSKVAVKDISFQIKQGEIFGLVGESGSGKSTVVQALIRTLPPPAVITNGQVIINDVDILSLSADEVKKYRWKQISIVMQSALT